MIPEEIGQAGCPNAKLVPDWSTEQVLPWACRAEKGITLRCLDTLDTLESGWEFLLGISAGNFYGFSRENAMPMGISANSAGNFYGFSRENAMTMGISAGKFLLEISMVLVGKMP